MKKSIILLAFAFCLPTTTLAAPKAEDVAMGAVAGAGAVLFLGGIVFPWISGKWEAQEKARQNAAAKRVITKVSTSYSEELALNGRLSRKQLVDVITGKFGNKECKYYLYDQELTNTIAELEGVNIQALEAADQEKHAEMLAKLHTLNREKNLALNQELVADQQKQRTLDREQADFNAKLDNQLELKGIIKEVKGVVQAQNNNRSWTEEKLNNIGTRVRDEGQETRQMLRDEASRNEHRWDREERHWERNAEYLRKQEQRHNPGPA